MKKLVVIFIAFISFMTIKAQEEKKLEPSRAISTDDEKSDTNDQEELDVQEATIYTIELVANTTLEWDGDLADGTIMDDLSWAWSSSNACFPETQKQKFTGNHVLYSTEIDKYSEVEVTVIPDDEDANFSIYAYQVGLNNEAIVPDLPSCIRCEADHKWDRQWVGKTQDHTRTVSNLVAINNPYKLIIAVVGAEGLTEGTYKLKITMKSR